MALTFLQANINHSARAQDLLLQCVAERLIQVAVVTEPYSVPSRSDWVGDLDGLVAVTTHSPIRSHTLEVVMTGRGFVATGINEMVIVAVYFSPNRVLSEFEAFLVEVGALIAQIRPRPVIVLGDLNAKSTVWGSRRTDARGRAVEEWLAGNGLCVLNQGTENTCVRRGGGSVIDVTFASPELSRRIHDWEVLVDEETLSDHRYIRFSVSSSLVEEHNRELPNTGPRWSIKRLNLELLQEAAIIQSWNASLLEPVDVDTEADKLCEAMTHICDAAMPRVKALPSKRQVYWWSEEIAELRRRCVARRRRYQRYRRRRRRETAESDALYAAYREASKALRVAIGDAKKTSWRQLLETLERDPWGRPYLLARQKLRPWAPPVTSTLQPPILRRVIEGLFPAGPGTDIVPPVMATVQGENTGEEVEQPTEVSEGELAAAVLRMRAKNTAPGPDGIPGRAWVLAQDALEPRLRELFSRCMREGRFPRRWKEGKLVLLRKEGRPVDEPSGYRPIVLLDEASKLLERVVAARIVRHLERVGPNLADTQFGFRRGRSTLDAISCVKKLSEEACTKGGVILAVSLDIANAFNTLPWSTIVGALEYHCVPQYLRRLVKDYLSDRAVVFPTKEGLSRSPMARGVPQGSALGPLLWNLGYDWVLRGANLRGISVVCYADDTLVTARGGTYREASILATAGVAAVVARIRRLGLQVALHKSEAICFHGPRKSPPAGSEIIVGGTAIAVRSTLKYLGVMLHSRWRFAAHLQQLTPKLMGTAAALARLLPNLGGVDGSCRRLYMAVVRSMALYGAPIWARSLDRRETALLHRAQRVMALRVCRGYRTISHEVACVLAGSIPWDLEAEVLSEVFWRRVRAREQDLRPAPQEVVRWRTDARVRALESWKQKLVEPAQRGSGAQRLLESIRPVLEKWVQRGHGALTFRLTQVLSGHGCFGRYLYHVVRKETTPVCHQCGFTEETAQHVLEVCPGADGPRQSLVAVLGADLSLPVILSRMVDDEGSWEAMVSFCETTVSQREAEEREREANPLSHPLRRARTRRRATRAHSPSLLGGSGVSAVGASGTPN